jgi:DNA mismatch repair ATPase MutS
VLCVFITHHPAVAALATARPAAIRLCHMASIQGGGAPAPSVAGAPGAGALAGMQMQPLYRLAPGVGPGAFALRVSALAGIPTGLLRAAAAQAERLHEQQRRRQHAAQQLRLAAAVLRACDPACTNTGPEARLPVLLRLQEDARVSLAGSP